ncbi:hypothetical protein TRICI_006909, partial [Trichomonascus ciferrii]
MMDRAKGGRTVSDSAINGESINGESNGLEKPLNENYLCLRFSEKGWKSKIEDAMSASKRGDGDFVIEFIECKGKFMDYVHWYLQRFVQKKHLLTADFDKSICIAIMPGDEHELAVRQYEKAVSNNLEAVGPGVSDLCFFLGSADVGLSGYKKQPDNSYKPTMAEILRAVHGREMTISSAMEYAVSQPQ